MAAVLPVALLTAAFACPAARAQSLFETLFGIGTAKPSAERTSRSTSRAAARKPRLPQSYATWAAEHTQSTPADGEDYVRDPAYGGMWRTVCVRTCDGYYWPVSRSVTRDRFPTDARRCEMGCAGEVRLFYQHRDNDDPTAMIDLEGRPYTELRTAFLYRKTLINGCGCRPAPWSAAERVRHHQYQVADDARRLEIAMREQRKRAERLRRDKIAQIIAATQAAAELDEAEVVSTGEDIAVVEIATNPDVSVTGYVHLHVLPSDAVEGELAEAELAAEPSVSLPELETAFAEIRAGGLPGQAAYGRWKKPRATKIARRTAPKSEQTVSLFGGLSGLVWPGDAPPRRRR